MNYLEKSIRDNMNRLDMTREEVIEMMENRGRNDGRTSATLKNPSHNEWPAGPHFNPHYERGYWEGFGN
jgi:hypothetical protein